MDTVSSSDGNTQRFVAQNVVLGSAGVVALLSASCCVIPIGLSIVGLGGAWLSFLGPFVAYREVILIVTSIVVGYLWLRMLRHKSSKRPRQLKLVMTILASLAIVLAWSAPLWEAEASKALIKIWADQR